MPQDYDPQDLAERLKKWAKGSLPLMAAVDFLIATDTFPIGYIPNYREGQPYVEFRHLKDDLDAGKHGYLSGGELATLRLACSLARGELDEWFWRLDPERQQAFVLALSSNR